MTPNKYDLHKKWISIIESNNLGKKKIGTFFDNIIYFVDGEAVRNKYDVEYVLGGHHLVYKWMPKNEIWMENCFEKNEVHFIVAHEMVEWYLMEHTKYSYEKAHDVANEYEGKLRSGEECEKVFENFLKKHSKDVDDGDIKEMVRCYKSFC